MGRVEEEAWKRRYGRGGIEEKCMEEEEVLWKKYGRYGRKSKVMCLISCPFLFELPLGLRLDLSTSTQTHCDFKSAVE